MLDGLRFFSAVARGKQAVSHVYRTIAGLND